MAGLLQPGALQLTVGQDSMMVEFQPGDVMTLSLNGDGHTFPRRGRKTEVKARWDEGALRVERKYEDGPEVVDVIEPSGEDVLLVHRTLSIRGVKVEGTLVYTREGSGSDVH